MAELDSTLRTRFAQINLTANAQKPQTDTRLVDDAGLKTPPSSEPSATRPIAKRDVRSVSFSVIPATSTDVSAGVSPKPQTPIAPPPALNLSIL